MRLLDRSALVLAFLCFVAAPASAQIQVPEENTNIGTSSGEFLSLGAGARGMALGGGFSAIASDAEALYHNPAGLPLMDTGLQGMFTVMPYFAETDYYWLGLAFPFSDGTYALGISLGNFGFSDQPVYTEDDPNGTSGETYGVNQTFVGLSFAHAFIDRFTGGATLKFISDNLGQASATAFAVDIGTNFHTQLGGRDISLAVVIQNLGSELKHSGSGLDFSAFPGTDDPSDPSANVDPSPARFRAQAFPLPTTFRVALAYDVVSSEQHRVTALGEFNETNNADPSWSVAGEYEFRRDDQPLSAALRLSYSYQPDNYFSSQEEAAFRGQTSQDDRSLDGLALGGGLKYLFGSRYQARLDYAYRHFGILGDADTFTFTFAVR